MMKKILLILPLFCMLAACQKDEPLIPLPDQEENEKPVKPEKPDTPDQPGGEGQDPDTGEPENPDAGGTEEPELPHGDKTGQCKDWFEVPSVLIADENYKFISHHAKTYRTQKEVRNYTACYDIHRHNPMWVAYPLHACYTEGGYTRPSRDPWRPDPEMTDAEQSIIYATDWNNWPWNGSGNMPSDRYHYWHPTTESFASKQGYIQGHLLRSADRGAGNKDVLLDLNAQTFYPTNIAPERYPQVKADVKGNAEKETLNHWTIVEGIAPDCWKCPDTLYIVTGCHYADDNHKVNDASNWENPSSRTKSCIVPTARYKVFLRTKTGNTGKSVKNSKASDLMTIAFWFPQDFKHSNEYPSLPALRGQMLSVTELENKLGGAFCFFPDIPTVVKDSCNPADWPGLMKVIDQPLDENYSGDYIYF